MPSSVTMERLARREESRVIRLAGSRAVQARRDAMLIELQPRILGIRSPAVRQETAHWSRQVAENSTGSLSPVLQQAVQNPAHIVLGIDLRDMVDAQRMRLYLNQSGLMPEDAMARVELPQLLTTLRGVYVLISITDTTSASVVIEFGADVGQVGDSVAAVFRQLMKDLQMSIDEFDTSTVTSQGNSVRLSMMLSDESLRRAVSLITAPSPEARANDVLIPSEPLPPESAPPRVTIELNASKRYFRAVSQAIDDLARVNRKASEYSRTAIWHDNFARRIEQLSTAGVEPVLLEFGGRVSERFHALAASLRGQAVQINAQQKTLVYNVDYRPGWVARHLWGAVGYRAPSVKVTSNLKEVRERQAAAVVAGTQERLEIWKLINSDRRDVRQKMQARYGDVFFQRRR